MDFLKLSGVDVFQEIFQVPEMSPFFTGKIHQNRRNFVKI